MKRLAILVTHPIQYYAPVFRMLHERGQVCLRVFYSKPPQETAFDPDFGRDIKWDIPLLEGYEYCFPLNGAAKNAGILIRALVKWQPDAVLVFGWSPSGHLAVMRYFKGRIPVLFRGDSTLLDERPGPRQWLRRHFLTWVYRNIDLAFYVGQESRRYFQRHGLADKQLVFAPHAIDNERFADGPGRDYNDRASAWREQLGIARQDFTIVFAGKLELKKSPDLLLKAVQMLNAKRGRPIHLIYVGSGPLEVKLKIAASNVRHVHFLGFQNQSMMPVVYRLGNIYCLPSRGPGETWGLAVNEALACGRPVVVSNKVGCAVDLVRAGYNGEIFSADQVESLVECLQRMLQECTHYADAEILQSLIGTWNFSAQAQAIEDKLIA